MPNIPQVSYALIGGSGTWGAHFPEDLNLPNVEVEAYLPRFVTPYGESAPFKLLRIHGEPVLRVAMHGCYPDPPSREDMIPPAISSKQVAWVLSQAGVKYALVEASVGGIQDHEGKQLPVNSAVILDDFIPYCEMDNNLEATDGTAEYYRLGRPFCRELSEALYRSALNSGKFAQVIKGGCYALTKIGRFETPAEINRLRRDRNNVVGQTIAHEASQLKKRGIHFGALTVTSNIAESGVADNWIGDNHRAMTEFYQQCPYYVAPVVVQALVSVIQSGLPKCDCDQFALSGLSQFPVQGA
jgi:5'-methylthioadenosine phosphorylase